MLQRQSLETATTKNIENERKAGIRVFEDMKIME